MKKFDFIIAGGGLVGATAALALSQLSLNVALVESEPIDLDKNKSTSFDQRAVALSAASVAIFKTLGLWDKVASIACPITNIHISDKGHFGAARLQASDYHFDALGQVIPLDQTGPILWKEMRDNRNIELFSPAEIIAFDAETTISDIKETPRQNKKHQATSNQIKVCLKSEKQQQTITAKLLLAADGTFSSVAKMASIETCRDSYLQHAIIANISTEFSHNHQAFERFTKQGPLALLPLTRQPSARNRMSLVWCQSEENFPKVMNYSDEEFIKHLQREFGYRLGIINRVGGRSEYPLSLHLPEQVYDKRLLLLGNSAHTLHPIAGQGFNLGLRDIATLCDAIQLAIKHHQDYGCEEFLEKYQAARDFDWQQTILATDALVRVFSNDFLPLVISRNKALGVLDKLPFVKEKLAMAAMGFSGESAQLTRGISLKPA